MDIFRYHDLSRGNGAFDATKGQQETEVLIRKKCGNIRPTFNIMHEKECSGSGHDTFKFVL